MFRHDWRTLASLGAERWVAALFSFDLRAALMGPIEAALLLAHFQDPRAEMTGATNPWGDHIGHTAGLAATSRAVLATTSPIHPSAGQIHAGYGAALIASFTGWAAAHGVQIRRAANRVRRCTNAAGDAAGHPIRLYRKRRRLPRTAEFQPLSPFRLFRYRGPFERDLAGRALEAARRAIAIASRVHCSSSSCRPSRSSGTT